MDCFMKKFEGDGILVDVKKYFKTTHHIHLNSPKRDSNIKSICAYCIASAWSTFNFYMMTIIRVFFFENKVFLLELSASSEAIFTNAIFDQAKIELPHILVQVVELAMA